MFAGVIEALPSKGTKRIAIKTKAKEILLLFGSLLFCLLVGEVIVRTVFAVKPELGFGFVPGRFDRYEFDESIGWRTKKSHSSYVSWSECAHHLYYNKDGFPCARSDVDKSASREKASVAIVGDSFVEGGSENKINFWDIESGKKSSVSSHHTKFISCIDISKCGKNLVTGSEDKTIRMTSIDGEGSTKLGEHDSFVEGVVFSLDGEKVV